MAHSSAALRVLLEALERRRCLFWTGNVLVELDRDFDPSEDGVGGVTMVLDDEDFTALKALSSSAPGDVYDVLVGLMRRAKPYLEPSGAPGCPEMAAARAVLDSRPPAGAPEQVERATDEMILAAESAEDAYNEKAKHQGWSSRHARFEAIARAVLDAVPGSSDGRWRELHDAADAVFHDHEESADSSAGRGFDRLGRALDVTATLFAGPPESDEQREAVVEAIALIRELAADLRNYYAPEKGLPAHIEQAEQVCSDLRNTFLAGPPTKEER